jgi:hypothetical protein
VGEWQKKKQKADARAGFRTQTFPACLLELTVCFSEEWEVGVRGRRWF